MLMNLDARSGSLELRSFSGICLKTDENEETLWRDGRSQELPDVYQSFHSPVRPNKAVLVFPLYEYIRYFC
jgi:hypothetical protein